MLCICLCDVCVYKSRDVCASVCSAGSDWMLAFESCDRCQSNVKRRKGLERRQTQT